MLNKLFVISLMFYYLIGSMLLPFGDFNNMKDLTSMYKHCKSTEEKDLTVFDFVTEHLIDIDCLFEAHESDEPDEKPHVPLQTQHQVQSYQIVFEMPSFKPQPSFEFIEIVKPIGNYISNYSFTKVSTIFHPPSLV